MEYKEFEASYINAIMPTIQSYRDSVNDPNFDKVLAIKNLYNLFHPLGCGNSPHIVNACELYSHMRYCIEDDGELLFVYSKVKTYNIDLSKYLNKDRYHTFHEFFVIPSDLNPDHDLIFKNSLKHISENSHKLINIEYKACIVDWELLNANQKYEEIISQWDHDNKTYFIQQALAQKAFIEYIQNSKYKTEGMINYDSVPRNNP